MKTPIHLVFVAVLSFISCSATAASPRDLVARAVEALGGEAALGQLKSIAIRGQDEDFEVESSYEPGSKAERRFAAKARFLIQRELESGNARIDWERTVLRTPKPTPYNFSEIFTGGIGYVSGIDTGSRIHASLRSNPPGHPMSGARAAITWRELTRQSPRLLLEMKNAPGSVSAAPAQTVDGRKLPAVLYEVRDWSFIVMFDPDTGLPVRIRTRDGDPIRGDSDYDLVLSDWRAVRGVKIAHGLTYQLNGGNMIVARYEQVTPNPILGESLFEIPIMARAVAARAGTGNIPYQWMIRRGYWGGLTDSDTVGWDVTAQAEPELVEIAPGVSQSRGTTHNAVVVEMARHLLVFDAPINEQLSEWVIAAARKRYSGKPVKYLVLTHHHWDHTSGARTYVAEGATVIVGPGNKEHFMRMFTAPNTALNDRLQRNPRKPAVIEVKDRHIISDGKRQVGVYHIEHSHSTGTLIGYIPDVKLGFVTDIWSPGRDPLPKTANRGLIELVQGVRQHNLDIERFAGGHGSTGVYRDLVRLVEQTAPRSGLVPGH